MPDITKNYSAQTSSATESSPPLVQLQTQSPDSLDQRFPSKVLFDTNASSTISLSEENIINLKRLELLKRYFTPQDSINHPLISFKEFLVSLKHP